MDSLNRAFTTGHDQQIRQVGLIIKKDDQRAKTRARQVVAWFTSRSIEVHPDTITPDLDLLLVLGGDGTLLNIAEQAARHSIPVAGINLGHLGFLTEYAEDETELALACITRNRVTIENRLMFKTRLIKNGVATPYRYALNEIVINKQTLAPMLNLATRAGDDYITTYKADGLIFSTPTGSTAYNLAAGGPLVHPGLATILVTPICPFMLSSRPIILPATTPVTAEFESRSGEDQAQILIDGQPCWEMANGNYLEVETAEHPLRLIASSTRDYFTILRNKLHWGTPDRQRT